MLAEERKAELEVMLQKMQETSSLFYRRAVMTGCHPFIEFTGLMNEYIKVCRDNLERGVDFADANTHSGVPLSIQIHQARYLGEKLECIFGPTLRADLKAQWIILTEMGMTAITAPIQSDVEAHSECAPHDSLLSSC